MRYKIISSSVPRLVQLASAIDMLSEETHTAVFEITLALELYPDLKIIAEKVQHAFSLESKESIDKTAIYILKSNRIDGVTALHAHSFSVLAKTVNQYVQEYKSITNIYNNPETTFGSRSANPRNMLQNELNEILSKFEKSYKEFYWFLRYSTNNYPS